MFKKVIFGYALIILSFNSYAEEGNFGNFLKALEVLKSLDSDKDNGGSDQSLEKFTDTIKALKGLDKPKNNNTETFTQYFTKGIKAQQDGDYARALDYFRKGEQIGDATSINSLGYHYQYGLGVTKNLSTAFRYYQKAANTGNKYGQFNVGLFYLNGYFVEKNEAKALAFYKRSADQGFPMAMYEIGRIYGLGLGLTKNSYESYKWYKKGADLDHPESVGMVGMYHIDDVIGQYNSEKAVRYLKKAIELGANNAIFYLQLGDMYFKGEGTNKDLYKAYENYRKSADLGNARALYNVGLHFQNGEGVTQDYYQARQYYLKAIEQNLAIAYTGLGFLYDYGYGVKKDRIKALEYYQNAGDRGDPYGYYNVGLFYEFGSSQIPKDTSKALAYFKKAISIENIDTEVRQLLSKRIAKLDKVVPRGGESGGSFASMWNQNSEDKATSSNDKAAPKIVINEGEKINIDTSSLTLSGLIIDDSKIAELIIDDELVKLSDSGNFSYDLYVPLGETKISVIASDSKGNRAKKTIQVTRSEPKYKNKDKRLKPPKKSFDSNDTALALIIGIDEYESVARAKWAEEDANIFYDFAQTSLGIPPDRIKRITGKDSDFKGIWKSIEQWMPAFVENGRSDVYVYFAGHGLASKDGEDVYLIPWDGDPELLSRSAIKRSELIASINKLNPSSVTMFLDTCYSGNSKGGSGVLVASARGLRIVKKNQDNLPKNFTMLSAASIDETAHSHPTLKHGLFSYWLMRGLGGEADLDDNEKITNGELHKYVSSKVNQTAVTVGNKQSPQLSGDTDRVISRW